jgi:hypothetical protein
MREEALLLSKRLPGAVERRKSGDRGGLPEIGLRKRAHPVLLLEFSRPYAVVGQLAYR